MDDDYEWQPPSEAELKIIQARQERSDKISKLMGDYMLKGYKMLGIVCAECSTILLQSRQGVNYCVACQELDSDTDKDDPVLNREAARSQILEGSVTAIADTDVSYMLRQEQTASTTAAGVAMSSVTSSGVSSQSTKSHVKFSDTVENLCQKINWATEELKSSSNVDYCVSLCQLIKSSADALQTINSLHSVATPKI